MERSLLDMCGGSREGGKDRMLGALCCSAQPQSPRTSQPPSLSVPSTQPSYPQQLYPPRPPSADRYVEQILTGGPHIHTPPGFACQGNLHMLGKSHTWSQWLFNLHNNGLLTYQEDVLSVPRGSVQLRSDNADGSVQLHYELVVNTQHNVLTLRPRLGFNAPLSQPFVICRAATDALRDHWSRALSAFVVMPQSPQQQSSDQQFQSLQSEQPAAVHQQNGTAQNGTASSGGVPSTPESPSRVNQIPVVHPNDMEGEVLWGAQSRQTRSPPHTATMANGYPNGHPVQHGGPMYQQYRQVAGSPYGAFNQPNLAAAAYQPNGAAAAYQPYANGIAAPGTAKSI